MQVYIQKRQDHDAWHMDQRQLLVATVKPILKEKKHLNPDKSINFMLLVIILVDLKINTPASLRIGH